jgi:hypothetical protein
VVVILGVESERREECCFWRPHGCHLLRKDFQQWNFIVVIKNHIDSVVKNKREHLFVY